MGTRVAPLLWCLNWTLTGVKAQVSPASGCIHSLRVKDQSWLEVSGLHPARRVLDHPLETMVPAGIRQLVLCLLTLHSLIRVTGQQGPMTPQGPLSWGSYSSGGGGISVALVLAKVGE